MPTQIASSETADQLPSYRFKPALMGPAWEFRLAPDGLDWEFGRRSGRVGYGEIRRMRLSFRPVTMQTHRFLTEIWPASGGKLQIVSSSWRSMVDQERYDTAYADFVTELHRRVAVAQPHLRCESGASPFAYWPGLAVFGAVALGLAVLSVRAFQTQAWAGAAMVVGFLALFLWQAGTFFKRNRPGVYPPSAPPPGVLPGR